MYIMMHAYAFVGFWVAQKMYIHIFLLTVLLNKECTVTTSGIKKKKSLTFVYTANRIEGVGVHVKACISI